VSRAATHAEIRAFWSHGEGNRKVRITRDGKVTYYGSRSHTDRSHDYWHGAGYVEQYGVDDDGTVHPNRRGPGRPVEGQERRQRYNVMLEPRLKIRAEEIGGGNFSAGVARAIAAFSDNQSSEHRK
jgi:hypothetical protein